MKFRHILVVALGLALLGPLGGCSFVFVSGPKKNDANQFPTCSPTPSAVLADLAITVTTGASFAIAVSEDNDSDDGNGVYVAAGLVGAFAASAVYGLINSTKCSRAREKYEAEVRLGKRAEQRAKRDKGHRGDTVSSGTEGGMCFANLTCLDDLYCDAVLGRCVPGAPRATGAACAAASECAQGLLCEAGVCAAPSVPECAQDVHCAEGSRCVVGRCEAIPGGEAAPSPAPL